EAVLENPSMRSIRATLRAGSRGCSLALLVPSFSSLLPMSLAACSQAPAAAPVRPVAAESAPAAPAVAPQPAPAKAPEPAPPDGSAGLALGRAHTCARLPDATLRCWGEAGALGVADAGSPWPIVS